MTSTNDGKDVKSNQTSGQKGKTYYIELYKSLEARLSGECTGEERTRHVCEAWRRVHCLCLHSAPSTHQHLQSWLQRHTSHTILQTEWQSPKSKEQHTWLADAINAFIAECQDAISRRNGVIQPWESQLLNRGRWFLTVLPNPWGHRVLKALLNSQGPQPSDTEVLEWLKEERGVMFVTRLRQLAASKCDDLALLLATAVMNRVRFSTRLVADVDQAEESTQDKPEVLTNEPTFNNILRKEESFTNDVWELLTDIELVLLYKGESRARCIDLAKQTPLRNGYKLVERLRNRLANSPQEKKLWKNAKEVATLVAQVVIARCMVVPNCVGVGRAALYSCVYSLVQLLPAEKLPTAAAALAAPAATSRHLHTLAAAVHAQCKEERKPFVCSLYVRAITAGMNELEKLKLETEKASEARGTEKILSSWFIQLGALLSASSRLSCECILTAFSVHPSPTMYELVKRAPPLAPLIMPDVQEQDNETNKEYGSWATDSRTQTNLVKTSETLKLKQTQKQANVLSTAIFAEGEGLGLEADLCQDLAVLLSGPRVKTLYWDLDREVLLENCRTYMERTHGGTRALTTELKYLNLDPNCFQHLPEEEDEDENNIYYGIEKGYEHLVEFEEPEPEDIICDDYFMSDFAETTDTGSCNSEQPMIIPKRKKKKNKQPQMEEEVDPLSHISDTLSDKKERPHSKERSHHKDKIRSKSKVKIDHIKDHDDNDGISDEITKEILKKVKKKERKERKKKEKLDVCDINTTKDEILQSSSNLSKLVDIKIVRSNMSQTERGNLHTKANDKSCITDSDYDSQGKSSINSEYNENALHEAFTDALFSMDELKSPEKTLADYSQRTSIPPYSYSPNTVSSVKEDVKKSIQRLIDYRRHKVFTENSIGQDSHENQSLNLSINHDFLKSKNLPNNIHSPVTTPKGENFLEAPHASVKLPPKQHTVVKNESRNICMTSNKGNFNSEIKPSFEINKDIQHLPANEKLTKKIQPKSLKPKRPQVKKQAVSKLSESQKQFQEFLLQRKGEDTQEQLNTTESTGQLQFREFLKKQCLQPTELPVPPPMPQDVSTQLPSQQINTNITASQKQFHNFLKELQESINAGATKEVQDFKSLQTNEKTVTKKIIQNKKVDNAANTYARLSYMHKNKQSESKLKPANKPIIQNKPLVNVTTEQIQHIKNIDFEKVSYLQASGEIVLAKVDKPKSKLCIAEKPKVLVQNIENISSCALNNPVLSNMLSSNKNITVSTEPRKNDIKVSKQCNNNTPKVATSLLSEKDQQDLVLLLRQQNMMNPPKMAVKTEFLNNPSGIIINNSATHCVHSEKQVLDPQNKISAVKEERSSCPTSVIKLAHNKSLNNESEKKQNRVKGSKQKVKNESDWKSVMDDILAHKTPTMIGPNALDIVLKKDSFEKRSSESLNSPNNRTVITNCKNQTNITNKDIAKPCTRNTNVTDVKPSTSRGSSFIIKPPSSADLKLKQNKEQATNKVSPVEILKKEPIHIENKHFSSVIQNSNDPFISGIPNSDYDLLEELMDDDLRQEIGELSSDEETYRTRSTISYLSTSKMKNNLHAKECNLPLNKANVVTIENPFNYCSTTSSSSVKKSNNSNYSSLKKESLKNSLPKTINQKNLGSPKDASLKPQIISNELITSGKVCKKVSGKILETDAPNNKLSVDKVSHKKNAHMTTCRSKNQHSNKISGNICSDPNLPNTVDNAKVFKNNVPQTPKGQNPAQVLLTVPQRNKQAQNVMLIGSTDLIYEPFNTINMNQQMKPGNFSDLNRNTYVAVNQAPMNVALLHSTPFVGPVLSPVIIESSVTVPVIQNVVPNISMNLPPLNSNKPSPICEGYQNINKNVTTEPILSKTSLEVHEKICQLNKDDLKEFLKFKDTPNESTTVESDMSTSSQIVECNTTTEDVAQPIELISNKRNIIPVDTESCNQMSTKQCHVENVPRLHLDTKSNSQVQEDERTDINTLTGKTLRVDNKTDVIMDQEIIKRKRSLISNKLDNIKKSLNVKQTALPFATIKSSKHDDKVQSDFRTIRKISDKNIDSYQKQSLPIAKVNRANRSSARLTALRDAPIAIQGSKKNCTDKATEKFLEGKCLTTEMNVPNNPKNLCSLKSDNCTKKESLGGHNLGNIEFPTPNNEINHSYKGKTVSKENIEEKIEYAYDSKLINNNQLSVEASDVHVKSVRVQTGGVVKKSCQKINKNVCKDSNRSKLTSCESISNENGKEVPIGPRKLNNNCEEVKKGKIFKNNSSSNKLVHDSVLPEWVDIEEQIKPVMIKSTIIESDELCKDNISLVCDNTTRDHKAVPLITPATIKSSMKKSFELCNDNTSSDGDKNATRGHKTTAFISPITIKNTVKKSDEFSEDYNSSDNTMRGQKAIPLIAPAIVKNTFKKSDELNKDNVSLVGSKNTQCDQKAPPPISSERIETIMKKCEDNISLVGGTNKARDHKATPLVSPVTIQTAIKKSEELSTDNTSSVSPTYTTCNQKGAPLSSPVTTKTIVKKSDELSKDNNSLVDDLNITRNQKATPLLSPAKVNSIIEISDELCTDNISLIDNTNTTHGLKVSVLKSQTNALKSPDELCKAKNITLVGKNIKLHENKVQFPNSQSITVKDTRTDSNSKLIVRQTPTVASNVKKIVQEILGTKEQDINTVTRSEQVNNGNSTIKSVNTTQPEILKPRQGSKDVSNTEFTKNFDLSKAKITYDDLPSPYSGPQKRCVRIKLPNGNNFKATISGKSNFNIDSIFDDPTVKSLLWKNINNNTKCTLNIKQVCILNKKELPILKTEVKNIFYPTSNVAELINLISDDEEDLVSSKYPQSFKTEFGNYNIRSMDSSTHLKHQKKLSQKSVVLLDKCNDLLDLVSKVKANEPDKCRQSKPSENPASALQETVSDYIEIDDSSNDSISVISSVTNPTNKTTLCSEKVDELKNLLLKDLGVDVSNGEIQNVMLNRTQGLTKNEGEIKKNNDIKIDTLSVINEINKNIEVTNSSDIQTEKLNIINEIHETIEEVDKSINFQTETLNLINENIEEDNMTEVEEDTPVCHVENNSKQFLLKLKKCDDLVEKLRIKKQKCFVSLIRCDAWTPQIENKDVCTYNEGYDKSLNDVLCLPSEICETTLKRNGSESILNDLDNTNVDLSSTSYDEPSAPLSPSLIDNFEIPFSLPENIDKSSDILLGLSNKKCDAEWCMTKSVISKYGSLNCSDRVSLEIIKKCDKDEDSLTDFDSDLDVSSSVTESFQVPRLVKLVVNLLANDSYVLERLIPEGVTSKFIQNRNSSPLKRKANEMEEIRKNKISKIENNGIDSKYLCRLKQNSHNMVTNNTVTHISEKETISHCALINEKSNNIDNEMKESTHPSEVKDNLQDDMQCQEVASLLRIAIRSFQGISVVENKIEDISNKSKCLLQPSLNEDFCSSKSSEKKFGDLIVSEVKVNDHCNDTDSLPLVKEMKKIYDCSYNTEIRGHDVRTDIIIGEVPRNEQKNNDIDDSEECNIRNLDNSECKESAQLIQLTETCPDIQPETDVYDVKAMPTVTKDNTPITTTLGEPNVLKISTFDSNMSEFKPEIIEELPTDNLYLLSNKEATPDLETNNPLKQTEYCVFKYETKADKDNDSDGKKSLQMITDDPTNIQQQIKLDITKNDTEFFKSKVNSDTQESRKLDLITISNIKPNAPLNSAYSNSLEEDSLGEDSSGEDSSFVEIEVKQNELNTIDQLNVHLESSTNLTQDTRLQDRFNYDPYSHDHNVEVPFEHLESAQTQEMPTVPKQKLKFKIEDKNLLTSYLKESEEILLNKSEIKGNDTFKDDTPQLKRNTQTLKCESNVVDAEMLDTETCIGKEIEKGSSTTCQDIHDYTLREWNPFDEVKSLLPIAFPESKLYSDGEILKKDKNSDIVVDSKNFSNSDTLETIPKLAENYLEIYAQAANGEVIKKDTNPYGFIVTSNEKNSETISPGNKSCKSKEVSDANITEKIISFTTDKSNSEIGTILVEHGPLMQPMLNNSQECVEIGNQSNFAIICPTEETKDRILDIVEDKENNLCVEVDRKSLEPHTKYELQVEVHVDNMSTLCDLDPVISMDNAFINSPVNKSLNLCDQNEDVVKSCLTEKSECVTEKATNKHSRLEENFNGKAMSNNLPITTKVKCSDDFVIHKNSTSMTSDLNNIKENTEAKNEPTHANKSCSDKDKTIDDIIRCKESACQKKNDNYESLEYIDVNDKTNLIKEFSESKIAGEVESISSNDNKFQNNVTLVYKGDSNVILKGSIYEDPVVGTCYVFPVINRTSLNDEMDCSNVCDDEIINDIESFRTNIYAECNNHNVLEDVQTTENFNVVLPKLTYSRQRLKNNDIISTRDKTNRKRKLSCYDHKFHAKRYRKGKNIDYPKFSVATMLDSAYSKEYKRLLDYWTTIKFSYSRPFHKEEVDVPDILNNWPIKEPNITVPDSKDYESILFTEEQFKNKGTFDPLQQTLAEEISQCNEQEYISYDINETNFNMGFGEGSDRVIQISEKRNYISKVSAATLSDVKQSQPVFTSEHYGHCGNNQMLCMSHKHQIEILKRSLSYIQLRDKVRSFFKKTTAELNYHWLMDTMKTKYKNSYNNSIFRGFPYDLLNSDFIEPAPVEATVQVVQVGQLPVSAAAQNPVTCDPRVTQVTDASPQCSIENSPHDDSQSPVKTEYTELTTADLSMPLVQEYDRHMDAQESSKMPNSHHEDIPVETEITSIVKTEITVELSPLKEEPIDYNDSDDLQSLVNKHINNVDYSFDSNDNSVLEPQSNTEMSYESLENHETDFLTQEKQQNGSAEKTDQIAHAMNAAGITTTPESMMNTRAHVLGNMLSQKNCQDGSAALTAPSVNNSYSKTVNAMTLQQALAQILPPPLNQTNVHENSQTKTNSSVTSQVLHIVQGKNTNGNQITLVDNSQNSVITNSNTPVLHIVQNKGASNSSMTNANPGQHTNSYSGLSLVDSGIQQGNNQLLHIVNTGNQKNNSTGQILKRVNLLTNLTNVQGSNEQKMVQFVCKSADGKSIHLNAPHQRSMVLRLQPIESPSIQQNQKSSDCQDNTSPSPTSNTNNNSATNKESPNAQHEIKSRSVYEENYAKFIQNSSSKSVEKSTSLPKFGQAFGKQVFQDGNQKGNEINANNSNLSSINSNSESSECQPNDNSVNLDHIGQINSPPLLLRKSPSQPAHSQAAQANLVQHIKQTIAPMNIQTMHGGVIYTRQIPVNIGGGQTINLITVPSTELIDEAKQKGDVKFVNQNDIDSPIIKIVPQNQSTSNVEASHADDTNKHSGMPNENAQNTQGQHQPVLTQMRIKLPMLSKTPQMVSGARVVRPSFFQIQRNVIGGANQHVYQQLVLTAAPPLGQHTIRLPQAQANRQLTKTTTDGQSTSETQMSSSTLEQLREFDMVLEQVKERSTVQPNSNTNNTFTKLLTPTTETNEGTSVTSTVTESTQQVLYSIGSNQSVNVAYINRKTVATTPTTSTFVRSPDSSGIIDSSSASSHAQIPHTVTSESTINEASGQQNQPKPAKVGSKKSRPKSSSNPPNSLKVTLPPKPTQKPLEDEQTTQRILYILAEYKEQVENSPDKDKPAPRRRTNPPTNPSGSSKRKKSYSGSRRPGGRDMSPVHGEDTCRTLGSEDSSCGTSQGDCNESCVDSHSPQDSPRKVVRKLTFENDTSPVAQPRPQPQRNVIVADGQTITVARGTAGKPATAVLMPANYILPVSMVKGGQQIAIVTNRGPKLLTVGGGERGATNALLLQRLIGPAGLKPVLTRPGVRHVRLPTAALHNLQAFNLTTATTVQPPDSRASPAPAPTPPELIETRANSSPWTDRESQDVKPERESSPEGSEPWNLPSSADPHDYTFEETVRTDNMNRTVLVVHKKDGTSQRHHRLTHVSAAALRHKYAILEHELRLQKSLSEECEDLGVDSPSASELFPEAELLFAASPAHDAHHHSHTPQPTILNQSGIPQPDMDDQIATDELLQPDARDERQELDVTTLGLDEGIVTVNEDGHATIQLDQEEFARSHPNTTFHSEPTDEGEVQPFTIAGLKGRHITSTIFHAGRAPATVLVTAPQTTVISQANPDHAIPNNVKYANMEQIINSSPVTHGNLNLSSVLVKDDRLTKFDNILTDSRELHLSNTASAIVHSTGNATQVIRRVCYEEDKRDPRYLMDEPDGIIAGDDAKMVAEDSSRDATLESIAGDVDDDNSLPGRHAELFWESNSASERSESRRPMDFSSDSEKCCKSPSYDETNSTDSSGVGTHMRLDSVIKDTRGIERSGSGDGSSADDTHPPLRTYPAKRMYHALDGEMERSMSGKTRAGERSPDILEVRRRASGRGVVKRGCHCCSGSPAPPRPKKSRQRKPAMDFTN